MTIGTTDKRQALLDLAGRLADSFSARAAEHDRDGSFPFENFEEMRQTRYLALTLPESVGGMGASILDFALCQERLAQGDGATALAVNMHLFGLGATAEQGGFSEPQGQMFARMLAEQGWVVGGGYTEPDIGGNWGYPATRAVREGGVYRLNGRKSFTSMSPIINFFVVVATIEDPDGQPAIGSFMVPRGTPGVEVVETWDTMGMRSTASNDLTLKDVLVPEQYLAERRALGNYDASGVIVFAWFSLSIASVYTGIALAARDYAIDVARSRRPSVLPRTIAHLPGIQFSIADMEIALSAARALTYRVAEEWMEGQHHDPAGLARVILPKYVATNMAIDVVNRAMQIVGGVSMFRRTPLERLYRDVRAGTFHPFANDQAREIIGKFALGIPMTDEPRWG